MNWGRKLILVFIAFAGLMSTLVYMCMQQNFELVSKDYYGEELRYQDKIDGSNNASKLSELVVNQNSENVVIKLPKELNGLTVSGEAWFYCATNASKDKKITLEIDAEGRQFISKAQLAKAKYLLKVNWKAGNNIYYTEKNVEVQ
jgi:hypothetical protein